MTGDPGISLLLYDWLANGLLIAGLAVRVEGSTNWQIYR